MMMMSHKHLHELLEEDQEPFLLNKFIADRRCQLNKPSPQAHLRIKKPKPISQNLNFPSNFCKNACFFSSKSPFFELASPSKSPCTSPNAIFLHIPAKTAALLLEAALRIQKQSSSKTKHNRGTSFDFFGSILKRLTHRNRNRKREIANVDGAKVSVKDILRWDPTVAKNNNPSQGKCLRRPRYRKIKVVTNWGFRVLTMVGQAALFGRKAMKKNPWILHVAVVNPRIPKKF
ncbi:growth-regulating factor 3 isoform X1 [Hibiscus syriacus]|uniref:Growth-regulating factor 3 isoform X1 n=1 Tax=Hibiscus syriacus TaxID=106335 RepID=A0A6A2ZEF1_HIBSY|nr:growth-regulating factor 3 isoform X1 [Hibiscus syriacus]